jgi:hypothetical protein
LRARSDRLACRTAASPRRSIACHRSTNSNDAKNSAREFRSKSASDAGRFSVSRRQPL